MTDTDTNDNAVTVEQAVRSRDEIRDKRDELLEMDRPEPQSSEDSGVYGLNQDGLLYDGRVAAVEWLLEEPRSHDDIFREFRELRNTAFTADRTGAVSSLKVDGRMEILRWALHLKAGEHPEDPLSLYERIDRVNSELFHLVDQIHPERDVSQDEFPASNGEVDIDQLHTELREARRMVSDVRLHMINGADVNEREGSNES